jgi:hypothetical protein|tara:strand:+ start:57 stop:188 length:132 start_codon:yes stop_codon:yes gene_type:complete
MIATKSKERVFNQIRDILLRMEEKINVIESKIKTKDTKKVING